MIFTLDGIPLQGKLYSFLLGSLANAGCEGITGGFGIDHLILGPEIRQKGTFDFVIESSCNGMFGVPWNGDTIAPPDVRLLLTFYASQMAYRFDM